MDKKLISAALLLFLGSLTILLADLGLITIPYLGLSPGSNSQESLGVVRQVQRQVRRKAHNRVIWQNSGAEDQLFAHDSILTLQQSAATLELQDDIRLRLNENTLVVLEPMERIDTDRDSSFRLRFFRGDLRSFKNPQPLKLAAGEWSLEVGAGADLSLRGEPGAEGFEVEVKEGEVSLFHPQKAKVHMIESGSRLSLSKNNITVAERIDPTLIWLPSLFPTLNQRVYSHDWPIHVELRWQGMAEAVRQIPPTASARAQQESETAKPAEPVLHSVLGRQSLSLNLEPGSHHFQLLGLDSEVRNVALTSATLSLHLWQAPRLRHLSPLPRDRYPHDQEISFSWLSLGPSYTYHLELKSDHESIQIPAASKTIIKHILQPSGVYSWSVIAEDEEGFKIPPYLNYPIHSVPDPLSPPKLRAPAKAPTSVSPPEPQSSLIPAFLKQHILNLILPPLYAQEVTTSKPTAEAKVRAESELLSEAQPSQYLLSWFEVEGADHYYLEISEDPQFENPLLTERVDATDFLWSTSSKKIHYYRVAAGSGDGRMGIFSEVMSIDPQALIASPLVEAQPSEPPPASDPVPAPLLISDPPSDTNTVVHPEHMAQDSLPDPGDQSQRALLPYETRVVFEFWYAPVYRWAGQSSPKQDFKASFSGSSSGSAGLRLSIPQHSIASWHFTLTADQHFWTLKHPSTSPRQKELKDQQRTLQVLRRSLYSDWGFGFLGVQWNQVERANLESLELKKITAAGPSLEREKYFRARSLQLRQSAGLLIGEHSLWALDAQIRGTYLWPLPQDSQLSTGIQVNALFWRNSQGEGHQLKTMLIFGWLW